MKIVKIVDIEVDLDLLNLSKIAQKAGMSQSYAWQLLEPKNIRKNKKAIRKIRDAIVELYKINVAA
jgi:hypothetical protein